MPRGDRPTDTDKVFPPSASFGLSQHEIPGRVLHDLGQVEGRVQPLPAELELLGERLAVHNQLGVIVDFRVDGEGRLGLPLGLAAELLPAVLEDERVDLTLLARGEGEHDCLDGDDLAAVAAGAVLDDAVEEEAAAAVHTANATDAADEAAAHVLLRVHVGVTAAPDAGASAPADEGAAASAAHDADEAVAELPSGEAVVDEVRARVEDEEDLLDGDGDEHPGGRDERGVVLAEADLGLAVQLELVDVEDGAREVADEEGAGDEAEDGQQGLLLPGAVILQAGIRKNRVIL